jgi:O-antigen/teichoic acid export membrane protein
MTGLGRKIASGASWMVAIRLVDRSLGLVSTIILARLLVPEDFGLVAMGTAVLGLLELASAFGFDIALIRQATVSRSHYDTAWTFSVLLGAAIAAALIVLAYPAAALYDEPRVAGVVLVLAAAPLIQGLENIGVVAFRKEMNFRAEFVWQTGKRLIGLAVVLPLAFLMRNYWALIAGMVVGRIAGVLLSYAVHPYRPRFAISARRELFGFSKWVIAATGLEFLLRRSADVVIGRALGPASLGIYNIAVEISSLPTTELVAPVNRAAYPAYARMAHDRAALRRSYLDVVAMVALLATPAAVLLAALAQPLVALLLGERWLAAVPLIQILAFLGVVKFAYTNAYAVFLAIGKPDYQVRLNAVHLVLLVGLMVFFAGRYGIVGAAAAAAIAGFALVPLSLRYVFRELDFGVAEFVRSIWRPALAAALLYAGVIALDSALAPVAGVLETLLRLAALGLAGAAIYVVALYVFWWIAGAPQSAERVLVAGAWRALQRRSI